MLVAPQLSLYLFFIINVRYRPFGMLQHTKFLYMSLTIESQGLDLRVSWAVDCEYRYVLVVQVSSDAAQQALLSQRTRCSSFFQTREAISFCASSPLSPPASPPPPRTHTSILLHPPATAAQLLRRAQRYFVGKWTSTAASSGN